MDCKDILYKYLWITGDKPSAPFLAVAVGLPSRSRFVYQAHQTIRPKHKGSFTYSTTNMCGHVFPI